MSEKAPTNPPTQLRAALIAKGKQDVKLTPMPGADQPQASPPAAPPVLPVPEILLSQFRGADFYRQQFIAVATAPGTRPEDYDMNPAPFVHVEHLTRQFSEMILLDVDGAWYSRFIAVAKGAHSVYFKLVEKCDLPDQFSLQELEELPAHTHVEFAKPGQQAGWLIWRRKPGEEPVLLNGGSPISSQLEARLFARSHASNGPRNVQAMWD